MNKQLLAALVNLYYGGLENNRKYIHVLAEKVGAEARLSMTVFTASSATREEVEDGMWHFDVPGVLLNPIIIGHHEYDLLLGRMFFFEHSVEAEAKIRAFAETGDIVGFYKALGRDVPNCLKDGTVKRHKPRPAINRVVAEKPMVPTTPFVPTAPHRVP